MRRALLTVLLCLLLPATAGAETRTAAWDDPQDADPTVSGQPNNPDVQRVEATYDSSGTITLTVRFHNDLTKLDGSQKYAHWADFAVGAPQRGSSSYACSTAAAGSLDGQHHVQSSTSTRFYDRAGMTGYEGTLELQRTMGADNRSITVTASNPNLAGRDFRCLTYELRARWRSYAEHPTSRYDEWCDCWYTWAWEDRLGEGETGGANGIVYFAGYAPPPLPACSNGRDDDGDGRVDAAQDTDCADADDVDETPHPCTDRKDNDRDGRTDEQDGDARPDGCDSDPRRTTRPPTPCGDERDNDRDTLVDGDDPDCTSTEDLTEDGFQLPALSPSTARRRAERALAQRFGRAWKRGRARRIAGCRTSGVSRVACRVAWRAGRASYRGRLEVWVSHAPGSRGASDVREHVTWTIRRTCGGRPACART